MCNGNNILILKERIQILGQGWSRSRWRDGDPSWWRAKFYSRPWLTGEPVQDTHVRPTPFPTTSSQLSMSLGKHGFRNPEDEKESGGWRDPTAAALGKVAVLLEGPPYPRGGSHLTGSSCCRVRTSPVSQGTGRGKTGSGPMAVSLLLWSCYWEPGRPEWGQSFRGWFPVQTMTRDGPSTAKMLREAEQLCLHTMRDVHVRLSQTPRPGLNVPSVCHLNTWMHGQHGPDDSTFVHLGHVDNFGPLFKLGLLLKSVVSQVSYLITALWGLLWK